MGSEKEAEIACWIQIACDQQVGSAMGDAKQELQAEELQFLLEYVAKNAYKARDTDTTSEGFLSNCLKLIGRDYKYSVVSNSNGELCSQYPTRIPVIEYMVSNNVKRSADHSVESLYDTSNLHDLFKKAKIARCRGRFALPVILYEGKHICRGATIAGGVEIYGRSGIDFFFTGGESLPDGEGNAESSSEWQLFNRYRGQDIKLLKAFSIGYICDLMVEKKKVKFGMNVTSSEKVDKENRYSDFTILSVPYPGCEFFREWRDGGYMAEGMMFDWNQGYVDAKLDLPGRLTPPHNVDWTRYKSWDLVKLTQNYLKLLLHYIKEGDCGLMVHCISGWDRTPLFVSLIRLSLWADGAIHPALGPVEILYLTIAYDWYLFGHNFPDRIGKGEEIFFFCFNFLKYITSDDFNIKKRRTSGSSRSVSRTDSECNIDGVLLDPEFQRASYRGSNTSINSISSLNSTKSSIDNAPIYFTTGSSEDEAFVVPNGNPGCLGGMSRASPATKPHTEAMLRSQYSTSTSPMAVPCNIHRVQQHESRQHSPGCGSWQIISGTGSFRGSASSYESPRSSSSDHSSHPSNGDIGEHACEETPRKQRLDAARRIFLSLYSSTLDFKNGTDGGGITGLFDQFAEKVGIRAAKSTPV